MACCRITKPHDWSCDQTLAASEAAPNMGSIVALPVIQSLRASVACENSQTDEGRSRFSRVYISPRALVTHLRLDLLRTGSWECGYDH
jgi:hypothetical protein